MRVAIIQHAPEYLNAGKSLEKAKGLIDQAAGGGNTLIVFGETWFCGYPAWLDYCPGVALWDHEPTKELFAKTYESSLAIDGNEMLALTTAARKNKVNICIGFNEKTNGGVANGTIFNSMAIINAEGKLVVHHRKLMPTFTEKMIYGLGDGQGLASANLSGVKVGGLICWEHWMPLARQAMHDTGEQVHLALWPKVHDMHQVASRQYAFEGRCFVIAAGQILRISDLPKEVDLPKELRSNPRHFLLNGGSCVIGPNGHYVQEPVFDRELILEAEIPIREAIKEKMTLDVTGHYQRNDVFSLKVNKERNQ